MVENIVKERCDIDSFAIVANRLDMLHPGLCFDVMPYDKRVQSLQNVKLFQQLKKYDSVTEHWKLEDTFEFSLGGSGPDEIYVIFHREGVEAKNFEAGTRYLFMKAVMMAIQSMPHQFTTYRITPNVQKFTKSTNIKIIMSEWLVFCKEFEIALKKLDNKEHHFIFYKCQHGLKSLVQFLGQDAIIERIELASVDAAIAIRGEFPQRLSVEPNGRGLLFVQIHYGIGLTAKPNQALLVDKTALLKSHLFSGSLHWYTLSGHGKFGTFAGIKKYKNQSKLTYFHTYIHSKHTILAEHPKCVLSCILQGRRDLCLRKLHNYSYFQQTLLHSFTLRIEGVLTFGCTGENVKIPIKEGGIDFKTNILSDFEKYEILTVLQDDLFHEYVQPSRAVDEIQRIYEKMEKPFLLDDVESIRILERQLDKMIEDIPSESDIMTIEDFCSKCFDEYSREYLLDFYVDVLPYINRRNKTNALSPECQSSLLLKVYAFFAVKYGLGQDILIDDVNAEHWLRVNYVEKLKEEVSDFSWVGIIDYDDILRIVFEPITTLGRIIFNNFVDKSPEDVMHLKTVFKKCLASAKVSAFPAVFGAGTMMRKVKHFHRWSKVVPTMVKSLSKYPTWTNISPGPHSVKKNSTLSVDPVALNETTDSTTCQNTDLGRVLNDKDHPPCHSMSPSSSSVGGRFANSSECLSRPHSAISVERMGNFQTISSNTSTACTILHDSLSYVSDGRHESTQSHPSTMGLSQDISQITPPNISTMSVDSSHLSSYDKRKRQEMIVIDLCEDSNPVASLPMSSNAYSQTTQGSDLTLLSQLSMNIGSRPSANFAQSQSSTTHSAQVSIAFTNNSVTNVDPSNLISRASWKRDKFTIIHDPQDRYVSEATLCMLSNESILQSKLSLNKGSNESDQSTQLEETSEILSQREAPLNISLSESDQSTQFQPSTLCSLQALSRITSPNVSTMSADSSHSSSYDKRVRQEMIIIDSSDDSNSVASFPMSSNAYSQMTQGDNLTLLSQLSMNIGSRPSTNLSQSQASRTHTSRVSTATGTFNETSDIIPQNELSSNQGPSESDQSTEFQPSTLCSSHGTSKVTSSNISIMSANSNDLSSYDKKKRHEMIVIDICDDSNPEASFPMSFNAYNQTTQGSDLTSLSQLSMNIGSRSSANLSQSQATRTHSSRVSTASGTLNETSDIIPQDELSSNRDSSETDQSTQFQSSTLCSSHDTSKITPSNTSTMSANFSDLSSYEKKERLEMIVIDISDDSNPEASFPLSSNAYSQTTRESDLTSLSQSSMNIGSRLSVNSTQSQPFRAHSFRASKASGILSSSISRKKIKITSPVVRSLKRKKKIISTLPQSSPPYKRQKSILSYLCSK